MSPATVLDVAERAGVSASTVSRALRSVPGISAETRKRVQDAAAELGYAASPAASRLATGRTSTIAVVAPTMSKWFFGQVIGAAGEVLRKAGYDVLLYEVADGAQRKRFFGSRQLLGRSDGVLVLTLDLGASELEALRAQGQSVAVLGAPGGDAATVSVDDRAAGRRAVRHLLNLGHERIAFIGIADDPDTTLGVRPTQERRRGYRDALAEAGITADPSLEAYAPNTVAGGTEAMAAVLAARDPATAAFVASDEMAFGALKGLRLAGVSVPDDFSVVGFDNHELSDVLDLTTMDHDAAGQGRDAARLLLDTLQGGDVRAVSRNARLVLRSTTAPPRPLRRRPVDEVPKTP
jgi:DNA-binding LacI/PurR family transcriptional regulator